MAARWLPNYDEFFFSLGNLFNTCEQQLNSTPSDRSEFLFRRLDEYERTLSTLISRFCETYGHELSQQTCLADLTLILRRTSFLRSHFETFRHCFLLEDGFNKRTTIGRCNSATASNLHEVCEFLAAEILRSRQDLSENLDEILRSHRDLSEFLAAEILRSRREISPRSRQSHQPKTREILAENLVKILQGYPL